LPEHGLLNISFHFTYGELTWDYWTVCWVGAVGPEMATVVYSLIEKHGGISGIVSQFE
jgi:hypothetical protein